jgi:hypothetical protein
MYTLAVIFGFSILIAGIIACIRFQRINSSYYPFVFCIWVACINEILSYILGHTVHNTSVNNNIYILLEFLLFTWQFERWGIFKGYRRLLQAILIITVLFWLTENFYISKINRVTFYFRIYYSFLIVLMSITTINQLIISERKTVARNATFLICLGFLIYYTFKVLTQTFWLYGVSVSREFRLNVIYTMLYINLLANLIYALAVLWMPTKQRFSMPF